MISFLLKHEIKAIKEKKATTVTVEVSENEASGGPDGKFHEKAAAKAKKQAMIAKSALASLLAKIPDDSEVKCFFFVRPSNSSLVS